MKNNRQEKILEIIKNNVVSTQEDLMEALNNLGFSVTQSTVSRDIKELRIVKALDSDGFYRYISAYDRIDPAKDNVGQFSDIFRKAVISIKYAMNNVVIRCYAGMASSACVALDSLYDDHILGSLAGDDTIFIITQDEESAKSLTDMLENLLK